MDIFDGIKNKLQDYESPLNQDEAWAELLVQKRARERSKKRRAIWLFLGCLFGLGGIGYWVERTQWEEQPITQNNHKPSNEIAIISDNSSKKVYNNSMPANTTPYANQTHITRQNLKNTVKSLPKQAFFSDKNKLMQKYFSTLGIDQNLNSTSANGMQTMPIAASISPSQSMERDVLLSPSLAEKAENITLSTHQTNTTLNNTTTDAKAIYPDKNQPLSLAKLPFKISPFEKKIVITMMASKPMPNNKSKHFEVYAGSGLFSTQQRFSTQDNMNKDYVALRNETETDLATFAFDAGINYWFSDKNFIVIGAQHNRWYDRLNYTYKQNKDYTYENILLRIVKNEQLGTQESQYGDTVITGTEIVKMTHFNRYVSSNLRLLLGRQIWSRKRLSLDLAGGMDWSVFATAKGNIAAPISTGGIFDLQNTGGNTIYKKSLGIGLSGTMSVNYRLNQHWAIQFRPSATYFLSDAARADAFAEARFYRFGAMLGLRYRL
jgi:hypothetical protein